MLKLTALTLVLCGTVAAASDGSYIVQSNPLYLNTAFDESGKVVGITMACGSTGRPDCASAFQQLHTLTDFSTCRDKFFIALIDQSQFASDEQLETEVTVDFLFQAGVDGKITITTSVPADITEIDCDTSYSVLMDERAQYVQE